MSLLSILGVCYFFFQVYIIKNMITGSKFKDKDGEEYYDVGAVVIALLFGAVWLIISGIGIYLMRDVQIFKNISF